MSTSDRGKSTQACDLRIARASKERTSRPIIGSFPMHFPQALEDSSGLFRLQAIDGFFQPFDEVRELVFRQRLGGHAAINDCGDLVR